MRISVRRGRCSETTRARHEGIARGGVPFRCAEAFPFDARAADHPVAYSSTTPLGKVASPNIKQRLSLLDRAVAVLRNPEDRNPEPLDRATKIIAIFGGASFPD
eukprot:6786280-Pyramimonas_sp.AAC.1